MEKMKFETPDLTQTNIEKIAALFPNCVTETIGSDGKSKRAINFDLLRQMLSDEVIDGDEAYEFTWVGKKAAIVEANRPIRKTLRPCPEESKDWDNTENLYIEGDNLEVLKLLQESYLGQVKMIYIDPPYNTGSDFVYPDSFVMDSDDYDTGSGYFDADGNINYRRTNENTRPRYHSDWCSMMYSRLILARNLLSDNGAIFISIDDNEIQSLRAICDEVFGQRNFIGTIAWESKTKSQNTKDAFNKLQPKIEYILVYTKSTLRRFNLISKGKKEYGLSDSKGAYREAVQEFMNADGIRGRETMIYEIDGITPPPGKQWQVGIEMIEEYKKREDLFVRDGKVVLKMRPGDERVEITEPFWAFFSKDIGTTESAKKELNLLTNTNGVFDTVKPVDLIKRLIFHVTKSDDLIMDFFSGSATTAHAIMQLNSEDSGHRKFIMLQLDEICEEKSAAYKAGYKNICEIGKERIRRAGEKIKSESPLTTADLDTGFRVFKLADSNMKDVYYTPGEITQQSLSDMVSNIKEDRTDLDLLFGCLLEWGLPLSMPYTSEQLEGYTVHTYNEGDLIACFDKNVPETVIKEIAKRNPLRAVFRDSSFADSPAKINVFEIFKLYAPDTRVKVI